ncbi:hypothetical protein [Undibacterium squillarum]|uniref:hypothetical protein n=1 Tax=Undibacterium squillarum TaxID=1131567 RepID=UPI001E6074C9|nr:hypothetical protein [Undibacterium squillarum]
MIASTVFKRLPATGFVFTVISLIVLRILAISCPLALLSQLHPLSESAVANPAVLFSFFTEVHAASNTLQVRRKRHTAAELSCVI